MDKLELLCRLKDALESVDEIVTKLDQSAGRFMLRYERDVHVCRLWNMDAGDVEMLRTHYAQKRARIIAEIREILPDYMMEGIV